jgi:hypothetical protein
VRKLKTLFESRDYCDHINSVPVLALPSCSLTLLLLTCCEFVAADSQNGSNPDYLTEVRIFLVDISSNDSQKQGPECPPYMKIRLHLTVGIHGVFRSFSSLHSARRSHFVL